MTRQVTLLDIAADAGVSRATVSLVMRGSPLVGDATRAKVIESAGRLGYVYNRAAASLRSQRSGAVGMIVNAVGNPYYAELAAGIEAALSVSGRSVILSQHSENIETQRQLLDRLLEYRVDGVILTAAPGTTPPMVAKIAASGVAVVLCTRRVPGAGVSYVGSDTVMGAQAVTEHLCQHDIRCLMMIGGEERSAAREDRLAGVNKVLANLAHPPEFMSVTTVPAREAAYCAATAVLRSTPLPIGVFAYNDIVAFGVAAAARELGLTIGREVRLVGFDDVEAARYEQPSLTTVDVRAEHIGRLAAETLIEAIDKRARPVDVITPNRLVVRRSCGCAGSKEGE